MRAIQSEISRITAFLHGNPPPTPFCRCIIPQAYPEANKLSKKIDLIDLFLWTWLDQTVYWVLVDERNKFFLNEPEVYDRFKSRFDFPKFWRHGLPGYETPAFFLAPRDNINLLKEKELLLYCKLRWWNLNVKRYFLQLKREDIIRLAEEDFRQDLTLRHRFSEEEERKLMFLWKE